MSATLIKVLALIGSGKVRVSDHGYDELVADDIFFEEILSGAGQGVVVEDYPAAAHGPSVLTLQKDSLGSPVHVVWGIRGGAAEPAVLVTAYRPDPARWNSDFTKRKAK